MTIGYNESTLTTLREVALVDLGMLYASTTESGISMLNRVVYGALNGFITRIAQLVINNNCGPRPANMPTYAIHPDQYVDSAIQFYVPAIEKLYEVIYDELAPVLPDMIQSMNNRMFAAVIGDHSVNPSEYVYIHVPHSTVIRGNDAMIILDGRIIY